MAVSQQHCRIGTRGREEDYFIIFISIPDGIDEQYSWRLEAIINTHVR